MGKLLKFKKEDDDRYFVENSERTIIGRIVKIRVGRWLHWCFFPAECNGYDLFFTNGCLKEISAFIATLYNNKG